MSHWRHWQRRGSAETLTGVSGHAGLQLLAQLGVIELFADQHKLVAALAGGAPVAVVDREAFAGQVEYMTPFALVEPEDAFGAEDAGWQLIIEKVLELAQ